MKTTDTHVYFWNGTFSNWHPAKCIDPHTNITFANTEQAFMWMKAVLFSDAESARRIEKETDPSKVKKLGRQVKNYSEDKWTDVRLDMMILVNMWKFTQNQDFKKELLDTGNKTLVEASPYDKVWGVGLLEDDPLILDEANWQGQNLLGKALMIVRSNIRNNQLDKYNILPTKAT